ncbi:MAG TPA: hypothetical protein ENF31_01340 [bacterium]|nr:hypothetical protein [bacterium]
MIKRLIAGFVLLCFNGIGGVTAYRLLGIPFHITFFIVTVYWSCTLLLTYYGTGWIAKRIRKWKYINILISSATGWWRQKMVLLQSQERLREKCILWLVKQKEWVVMVLTFVPLIPELPTITIIAARLMKIKYALPILLTGNLFRTFVLVATIYQLLPSL